MAYWLSLPMERASSIRRNFSMSIGVLEDSQLADDPGAYNL
jgi:hypothetical protein